MTIKEKRVLWNEAVRAVCGSIKEYDGIIPDEIDRKYMSEKIMDKWLYKRMVGVREFNRQKN